MIKTVGLFTKRPGMDREAFIDRYESPEYGHAQFAIRLCPWQDDYRRNFIRDTSPITYAHLETSTSRPPFDVVMITKARDAAQAELTAKALADPIVGGKIARDEEALFDRSRMTIFGVEERETPAELLAARPAGHVGAPALKMLGFARRRDPGIPLKDFIQDYESTLAPLVTKLMQRGGAPIFAGYVRNYVQQDVLVNQGHITIAPPKPDFDVMNEIWFWTERDFESFQDICSVPDVGAQMAAEQTRLLDPASINMVFVDEYFHTREMLDAALKEHDLAAN